MQFHRLVLTMLVLSPLLAACGSQEELAVGACILTPGSSGTGASVSVAACANEHYGEIVGTYVATGGPFPGVASLADESWDTCRLAFEETVGLAPSQSVFDLAPLTPSESSWENGDRTVWCVVRSATGDPLEGSVKGTAR